MSMIALSRLFGYKVFRDQRVSYMDCWTKIMDLAHQEKWRIFYLGSSPTAAAKAEGRLRELYPDLQLKVRHGFFNADAESVENNEVLDQITRFLPHLLMVGMGMPRQEIWIENNFDKISANIILPSGATLDYIGGTLPTPPAWAGRMGLAWAFRLAMEPKRLASRYLLEPWSIVRLIASNTATLRSREFGRQGASMLEAEIEEGRFSMIGEGEGS
jgi:N-acetylglucosaminyldiphosphoundecaprenol N-acetyl-beta-D-mannosaminyltransferase